MRIKTGQWKQLGKPEFGCEMHVDGRENNPANRTKNQHWTKFWNIEPAGFILLTEWRNKLSDVLESQTTWIKEMEVTFKRDICLMEF
jgi:hypothetical protein